VESLRGDRSAEHDPKNRLEALEVERDGVGAKLQETVEQTHRLEALLEAAAVAYRLLYRDSVPRQGLQRTRAVLAQERLESAAWRRRAEVAEQQVGELRSEVAQLREAIHLEREMGQMDREREVTMLASAERYEIAPLQSDPRLDHIDTLPLVDLVINHASLASSHYANEIHDLTSAFRCASADLSEITSSRDALHSSLSTLQVEHTKLQSLHAAVVAAHAPCDGLAAALRSDLQRANVSEARQRSLLHDTEEEVSALEERNRADRELLKRANDTAARAKLAENALVDELKE
jgi:chromosome segregation ATPase